jgi:hypothetical protein
MAIACESDFRFSDPPVSHQRFLFADQNIADQWPFPELVDVLPNGVFVDKYDPDLLPRLVRVGARTLRGDIDLNRGLGKHDYIRLLPYIGDTVASKILEAVKNVHAAMGTEPHLVDYFNEYWFGHIHYFTPEGEPNPRVTKEVQTFVVYQAEKLSLDASSLLLVP